MSVETVQETLQKATSEHDFILSPLINALVAIIILMGIYDWWYRYKAHDNRPAMREKLPTPQELPIIGQTQLAAGLTDSEILSFRGRR